MSDTTVTFRQCDCAEPCCSWRCCRCERTWTDFPGQQTCQCGSVYVRWTNYAAWRGRHSLGVLGELLSAESTESALTCGAS